MGNLIKDLALGQNPKRYRERGELPCAACAWVVTGKITSRGGCFFALQPLGMPAPFPTREPLAASVWEKVWKKEDQSGVAGVGFELGLWLRD